ncbi:hypothetical protein [Paracraurococcus ruber]|uniref:Uncharacterized protein n=1 Tax=Paracraurococcus ruber TaxID=77675 RepID=A0ABS1D3F9_9PROT|nr:hypothetical protein [Paracraurococcus ruber]MBK1660981.1 hypothetical protein [Paracraurococcus ruber]
MLRLAFLRDTAQLDATPAFLKALSPKGLEIGLAGQVSQFRIGSAVAKGKFAFDVGNDGLDFAAARMRRLGIGQGVPASRVQPKGEGDDESKSISAMPDQINAIFDAIGATEGARRTLEARQRRYALLAAELRERVAALTAQLAAARGAMAAAARRAQGSEGDYLSAQRLVAEEGARVAKAAEERQRILGAPLALLYVRRRQAQVAVPLPDPLALRATAPGDIVPGCRDTHEGPLPEGVDQFLDFVLDLPVAAFAALQGLQAHLPGGEALAALGRARTARLLAREAMAGASLAAVAAAATPSAPRLLPVLRRAQALLAPLGGRSLVLAGSFAATQQEAAKVLSVADVLAGRRSPLREAAGALRDRLETAGHCTLAALAKLPPSVRFAWSEAAEDDSLDLPRPERWPFFDAEEGEDEAFNALRSLTELVRFLFAQLSPAADGTAQAAMGSYLRALLIEAAHGEPAELLRGRVTALPRLVQPGAILRLALNRDARPGTRLHLLDAAREVVAELRVEDRDGEGTVASLVRLTRPAAAVAAGLSVAAAP